MEVEMDVCVYENGVLKTRVLGMIFCFVGGAQVRSM